MKRLCLLISACLLAACGGGGDGASTASNQCSIEEQKQFVFNVMEDIYLYYDLMPNINLANYDSPEAVLEALRVSPDEFSSINDTQSFNDFFEEGVYNGFGFGIEAVDGDTAYALSLVFDSSPAGSAHLQRGDRLISVMDTSVSNIISQHGGLYDFLRAEDVFYIDYPINMTFELLGGGQTTITLAAGPVYINTVLSAEVIDHNGLKIGYLAFSDYLETSNAELDAAFSLFSQENIDELVLDLRYNGGGRISVAQYLSSYIAGTKAVGSDVTRLEFNDKSTQYNEDYPFLTLANAVDINRLYVLVTGATASSSELTINAMDPVGIEVITIGDTTFGKPVGSVSTSDCGYTISPIAFDVVNDRGQGGYFDGIDAVCAAEDDLSNGFADVDEGMLATALFHIDTGMCSTTARGLGGINQPSRKTLFEPNPLKRYF